MHRYTLEPYKGIKTRYRCPSCGNPRIFVRYIDTATGAHLADHVGRCSREVNCAYHYTPKQFFAANGAPPDAVPRTAHPLPTSKPLSYIPPHICDLSFAAYEHNNFVQFLAATFGAIVTYQLITRYHIGTSKHWPGAAVFWQVDRSGYVRTGKIMLYDAVTGKRVKHPYNHITWAHKVLQYPRYELSQCFFGQHLLCYDGRLGNPRRPVAIVESEKTAIIASVFFPDKVWLACGSLTNLTTQRCLFLRGHEVTLYPDLGAYDKWLQRAREMRHLVKVGVCDVLEQRATAQDREKGLDIADFLLRKDADALNYIRQKEVPQRE